MVEGRVHTVLRYPRLLTAAPGAEALADAELLGQFVERRDEAAFNAIVGRHGPLVYGLCRRLLGQEGKAPKKGPEK